MTAKAKELDNRHDGDRRACPICSLRRDRVPLDHVWAWSLEHVGESPFRTAITQVESDN